MNVGAVNAGAEEAGAGDAGDVGLRADDSVVDAVTAAGGRAGDGTDKPLLGNEG